MFDEALRNRPSGKRSYLFQPTHSLALTEVQMYSGFLVAHILKNGSREEAVIGNYRKWAEQLAEAGIDIKSNSKPLEFIFQQARERDVHLDFWQVCNVVDLTPPAWSLNVAGSVLGLC